LKKIDSMNIEDLIRLLKSRASCRSYLDKDVPDLAINNCLEAARLAPSACNKQPWRFIIVKNKSIRDEICDKCLLPGISMPWLSKAPVIVVLCAEKNFLVHKAAPLLSGVPYHYIDAGIAGEHFVLAAETQGLASCWIGWFNKRQIRNVVGISRGLDIVSLISLGYPDTRESQPEKMPLGKISSFRI